MLKVFSLFASLMLALLNIVVPFVPTCPTCDNATHVICEECEGEGFVRDEVLYSEILLEVYVACEKCEGRGIVDCPDCPEITRKFYRFKSELEKGVE